MSAVPQHPLQILFSFPPNSLSFSLTAATEDCRRCAVRRDGRELSVDLCGTVLVAAGGKPEGLAGGLVVGGGGGVTLAALPIPLGSLAELFRPPALPGPRGMPLTPASWAVAFIETIKPIATANAINADRPDIVLSRMSGG
jgi:hypothetical protein